MTQQQIIATVAVAVVAVVGIGGGVAYSAKNAEPGDMFYNLRASLYGDVSGDAQAQADLQGARDAYDEAERMNDQGTLTASERARITAQYSAHVSAVATRIAQLEANGDVEAAASLRTELRAILRDYRDVFPTVSVEPGDASSSSSNDMSSNSAGSEASQSMTSDDNDDDESSSSTSRGAASSIFVQPSSSVTSA